MSCLPDETLFALASGALPTNTDAAHQHLDSCPKCRRMLVALSAGVSQSGSARAPADAELPIGRGTRIGRYEVTKLVGAGGMGAVYSAHDPELDRCVAVKLLHSGFDGDPARLRREARAMARLVHPNVVQVYDAGEHGARTFVAMELVEGRTLRAWLAERPRRPAEIVAAFVEAGRGLSAAHEAGLLHRDFKPDNVFVASDGRVKVGDFGLARPLHEAPESAVDGSAQPMISQHACGTPAYLAPEVMAGTPASVASDVYSFCVSLWEGLYAERPFAGSTAFAILQQARSGRLEPAASKKVPARLRRILERGLAADPLARPPSMADLLVELEPRRRSLFPVAIAGAAAMLAAIAFGGVARPALARCSGAATELAPAWSKARRGALEQAFRTAKQEAAWPSIDRALSAFGASWVEVHTRSCRATRVEGHQSEDVLERRQRCLTRQRQVVAALGDLWLSGQPDLLSRAPAAIAALPLPATCGGDGPLNAPAIAAPPPPIAASVAEVRGKLAEVAARLAAGDPPSALPLAREAAQSARKLVYPPLEAEALLDLGRVLKDRGDFEEAERTLQDASLAAASAGHDQALADALVLLARVAGVSRARPDDGDRLVARAAPVVSRLGDRLLAADLEMIRGNLRVARGDYDGACRAFTALLPTYSALLGPDHPKLAEVEYNLFLVATDAGRQEDARTHAMAALHIVESAMPADHVNLYPPVMALATTELQLGHLGSARGLFERAAQIAEKSQGPDGPYVAAALGHLAGVMSAEGDVAASRATEERALRIAAARGPAHPFTAYLETAIGERAWQGGATAEAIAHLQRSLAMREQRYGHKDLYTAETLALLGRARLDAGHADGLAQVIEADAIAASIDSSSPRRGYTAYHACEALLEASRARAALPHCRRTLAATQQGHPPMHPDVIDAERLVAEAEVALGRASAQRAMLETAVISLEKRGTAWPREQSAARFALARVLAREPDPAARARAEPLARSALEIARKVGSRERRIRQIESFLAGEVTLAQRF